MKLSPDEHAISLVPEPTTVVKSNLSISEINSLSIIMDFKQINPAASWWVNQQCKL
jgi:hypothetical protein